MKKITSLFIALLCAMATYADQFPLAFSQSYTGYGWDKTFESGSPVNGFRITFLEAHGAYYNGYPRVHVRELAVYDAGNRMSLNASNVSTNSLESGCSLGALFDGDYFTDEGGDEYLSSWNEIYCSARSNADISPDGYVYLDVSFPEGVTLDNFSVSMDYDSWCSDTPTKFFVGEYGMEYVNFELLDDGIADDVVESISELNLEFNRPVTANWDDMGYESLEVKDFKGNTAATIALDDAVIDGEKLKLPFESEITAAGAYTVEIPQGLVTSSYGEEIQLYTYEFYVGKTNMDVDVPGTLGYKLLNLCGELANICDLTVSGNLNADDFDVFGGLSNIVALDLSQTNITEMGGCRELSKLKKVVLPETVTRIADYAFYECPRLAEINLGNVTSIGNRAFYDCDGITALNLPNVTNIGNYAFDDCGGITAVEIPKATSIGNYAFKNCYKLSSVVLSDNLTYIPYCCFQGCSSLESIVLPASLKDVGDYAFYYCNLREVTLPEGVESVNYEAFYGNPLESVTLPSTIKYIGEDAFYGHSYDYDGEYWGLRGNMYCHVASPFSTSAFSNCSQATLYVLPFAVSNYKLHGSWRNFGNIQPMEGEVSDITFNSNFTMVDYTGLAEKVNITLEGCAHLTVAAEETLAVGSFAMDYSSSNEIYNENTGRYDYLSSTMIAGNEITADEVAVNMNLYTDRWHFISLPFDANISDIEYTDGARWVIRKYSGADRAAMTGNTWQNMTEGMVMNAGEGYILQCDHDNYSYVDFTFHAVQNGNISNIFTYDDARVALAEYQSEYAHNRSWNLVGNPYPAYFATNGNIEHEGVITVWEGGNRYANRYVAYSLLDDNYVLKPFESFFTQRSDDASAMIFNTAGRSHYSDASDVVATRSGMARSAGKSQRYVFNFHAMCEGYDDKARIVINEDALVDYETTRDAEKMFDNDNRFIQLYVFDNGIRYAIDERPYGDGVMNLGVQVGESGEYTLKLQTTVTGVEVMLRDNVTGDEVDIVNGTYSFTAAQGVDDTRFTVVFKGGTTAVELVEEDAAAEMYDLGGRKVTDAANGVYIIKQGGKVLKSVVR